MSESLVNTVYLAGAFLLLFGSAELLYHKAKVRANITRKYVHICTGLLTLLFPPLIANHWLVLLLCSSFLVILVASMKFKLLPSINAVDRVTRGSLIFPIIVYGCYLLYMYAGHMEFYYIPILTLALCDPIAEMVGKNYPKIPYTFLGHTKTISGSSGFFVAAILTSSIVLLLQGYTVSGGFVILVLLLALSTTIAEALSHKGYDNLTIPLAAAAVLCLEHFHLHLI